MTTSMTRRARRLPGTAAASLLLWSLAAAPGSAANLDAPAPTWGTNGRVNAIVPAGNRVYLAGTFTQVTTPTGASYPAAHLAAFNPATGQFAPTWQAGTDGPVNAMAYASGILYIGGKFTTVDGQRRGKLAALDAATGALQTQWKPATDRPVDTLAAAGGSLYLGGPITKVTDSQGSHPVTYTARLDQTTGRWDSTWTPKPDGRVRKVLASTDGTRLFLAGDFATVSGQPQTRSVASVTTTSGLVDPAFALGPTNRKDRPPVNDMTTDGTHLLLAVAGAGGACTSVSPTSGTTQWSKITNGNAQAAAIIGTTAYCGGHFSGTASFDGLTRYKAAAVNLGTGQTLGFAPRINSALGVWEMAATGTDLYLGGDFTKISGKAQPHFAAYPNAHP